jgi:hypothetical protein
LGGEKVETGQILDLVSKDRPVSVQIHHLLTATLESQLVGDGGRSDRKKG